MTSRAFPANVVVSVVQNRLLCPMDDYRDLINYMTGHQVPLWDLTRAREVCMKRLVSTFPILKDLPPTWEKTDSGNANKYVRACVKACAGVDTWTVAPGRVKFAERTLSKALSA